MDIQKVTGEIKNLKIDIPEESYNSFKSRFGVEALKKLEGPELALRLYADKAYKKSRGLFNELEYSDEFGSASGLCQGGINYRTSSNRYEINRIKGQPTAVSKEEAIESAKGVRECLQKICKIINDYINEHRGIETIDDYKAIEKQIQEKSCGAQLNQVGYLKYLHMIYRDYFATSYSQKSQEKVLEYFGEELTAYNSNFIRSAAISLLAKEGNVSNYELGVYCGKKGVYGKNNFKDFQDYLKAQNIESAGKYVEGLETLFEDTQRDLRNEEIQNNLIKELQEKTYNKKYGRSRQLKTLNNLQSYLTKFKEYCESVKYCFPDKQCTGNKPGDNSGEESKEFPDKLKNLYNRIIFGAPGTGKSHKLQKDQEAYFNHQVIWKEKKEDKIEEEPQQAFERVTFHPDYYYSNFVGTYKPVMNGKDIEYKFVPGPFLRVYAKAKHNTKPVLLIIEEINRANVAAVFGDVFQLLDRNENGNSEYPIAASEDVKQWLAEHCIDEAKLSIPSNMYIWATMNSADQGVFPMDTAFKRRWSFEYLDINKGADVVKGWTNGKQWNEFREAINDKLVDEAKINEDKCMGPFFLKQEEVALWGEKGFDEIFKSKILMYLFEDAGKQKRSLIFSDKANTFSRLCNAYDKKEAFKNEELNKLCPNNQSQQPNGGASNEELQEQSQQANGEVSNDESRE